MNIEKLYEAQKVFMDIITERVKKVGYDTNSHYCYDDRVFAFHCELMEFANEIGFFKFWKLGHERDDLRMLDEGVDCVHLLLDLGLMKRYNKSTKEIEPFMLWEDYSLGDMFRLLRVNNLDNVAQWTRAFELVLGILRKLGFSENEIEEQYFIKNEVNLDRQENNY